MFADPCLQDPWKSPVINFHKGTSCIACKRIHATNQTQLLIDIATSGQALQGAKGSYRHMPINKAHQHAAAKVGLVKERCLISISSSCPRHFGVANNSSVDYNASNHHCYGRTDFGTGHSGQHFFHLALPVKPCGSTWLDIVIAVLLFPILAGPLASLGHFTCPLEHLWKGRS